MKKYIHVTKEDRAKAIDEALNSPLLNDNKVYNSQKVLIHIIEPGPDGEVPLMVEEMNDITDFMDKMQMDVVETKWGLSYNPELKDKVKITILASGFGMDDLHMEEIDERSKERGIEQVREAMALEQKKREQQERRDQYYGTTSKNGYIHRAIYSYIFRDEDLDDDDQISSVESSPTGKRTKKSMSDLERRNAAPAEAAPAEGELISF